MSENSPNPLIHTELFQNATEYGKAKLQELLSMENLKKIAASEPPMSWVIRNRLLAVNHRFHANDNISDYIFSDDERAALQEEIRVAHEAEMHARVIDIVSDHNSRDTPNRVAKMIVNEIDRGRYYPAPKVTQFPNISYNDQLYVTGPITIKSRCSHHELLVDGRAYVGIYPGENVAGLSKFNRIVEWFASRPQIQEEMTGQIADKIEELTGAAGVAVYIEAEHHCMLSRGVREHTGRMTTSVVRGELRTNDRLKQEFLSIVASSVVRDV